MKDYIFLYLMIYDLFYRPRIKEIRNLYYNFSHLFFEHGYLTYYLPYHPKTFYVYS